MVNLSLRDENLPELRLPFQFIPCSKTLADSVIKTCQLILYREIIAVCSEIHTKHMNAIFGHIAEVLGALKNCEKLLLALSCLSVRMEELGFNWTDFHEI
jgi:hypothetical protein